MSDLDARSFATLRRASTHAPDWIHEPPEWTYAAECQWTDPEIFFPEKGGTTHAAKKVCGGCTVRAECLAFALERNERHGIYGGLSTVERRKLVSA
jgi:WhiB family redox-sensing transcriptional regulator